MPAGRLNNRRPGLFKDFAEIFHLTDPVGKIILFQNFIQPGRHRFNIPTRHSAIGWKSLDNNHKFGHSARQLFIIYRDKTAHIGQTIFFRRHQRTIGVGKHFLRNFPDSLVLEAGFVLFDKIGIFGKSRTVEKEPDTVLLTDR